MEIFANLSLGFSVALSPINLVYCFLGVLLGTFIGVLPGVGPFVTISVLLPLTYGMPPESSLIMLAGIYYGAQYGGSTTAILCNLPGEPGSAVSCIDGYQMARQGRAGPALAMAAIGSLVAGTIGTLLIAVVAPPLTLIALKFRAMEYFSLMLMALVVSSTFSEASILKGIGMALLGVLVGIVGTDVQSGVQRFTFEIPTLFDGIDLGVVAIGLFAFAEIIRSLGQGQDQGAIASRVSGLMPTREDFSASWKPILRGTAIGSFFGTLPGAGPTISAFVAYLTEKKISSHPERFGRGAIEGVASPESANNAAAQTSFIPTLTLGVPSGGVMALLLGALIIQGISPGPSVMTEYPRLFWGLVASMWIGNVLLVILNLPLVGLWVKLLSVPYRWLYPSILAFACIGIFSVNKSWIDVCLGAWFGLVGYIALKLECEPAPFILGCVVGPMMEVNFQRAMLISRGDPTIFLLSPISATFLVITVAFVAFATYSAAKARRTEIAPTA